MQKLTANWKTTAVGLLILALASLHSVNFDAAGHLAMTAKDWFTLLIGFAATTVGYLQKDAGREQAIPPGGGDPVSVPSHETPDDPGATPVVEKGDKQ